MALDTNLNQSPYYDDYDETKNFHRVLFRPGFAVQARELTQMQTILQKQTERFASHIFTEGAIVTGCPVTDSQVAFVKIRDDDVTSDPVDVDSKIGLTVTGGTTGMTAVVKLVLDGTEVSQDKKTLYVAYTNSGTNGQTTTFTGGETLTFSDGSTAVVVPNVDIPCGSSLVYRVGDGIIYAKGNFIRHYDQSIVAGRYTTRPSVKVGFGVREELIGAETDSSLLDPAQGSSNFSAPGADRLKLTTFLRIVPITAVVPAGTSVVQVANTTSNTINTQVNTTTAVQPSNTVSATTQPVQAANGQIVSTPAVTNLGVATPTQNFSTIVTVDDGVTLSEAVQSEYAKLGTVLAQNISEINGNFTIRPFVVNIKENLKDVDNQGRFTLAQGGNANSLSIGVEGGAGFIQGFRYEFDTKASVYRDFDKGIDTAEFENISLATNYGQYIVVNDVAGVWDSTNLPTISLRDQQANAVIGGTFDLTAAPGNEIGVATLRNFIHEDNDSNNPDGEFRVYLQDIQMSNSTFQDVRSLFISDAGGSGKNAVADCVLEANNAVIKESTFNILMFNYPFEAVKTLRDASNNVETSFQFKKSFDVTFDTNGRGSISTGSSDEIFTTNGALNDTQKDNLFTIVATSTGFSALAGTVSLSNGSDQVVGNGTQFTSLEPYQLIRIGATDIVQILSIEDNTHLTLTEAYSGASHSNEGYRKVIQSGEILDMSGNGVTGTRAITITSTTSADIDIEESLITGLSAKVICTLQKTNAREASKTLRTSYVIIDPDTSDFGTNGPWWLGFSDVFSIENVYMSDDFTTTPSLSDTNVTSDYTFDSGQKAGYYDTGRLVLRRGRSAPTGQLLVVLKYFDPNYTQGEGYFSVDSYPVNDDQVTPTTIKTYQIPMFVDPATGNRVNLRNVIDIRPVKTNTATQTTNIGSAAVNPAHASTYNTPSGGQYMSIPNENVQTDLIAYFGRIDKLIINADGNILMKRGVPDLNPVEPLDNEGMMTIARVTIPPYPSISPYVGTNINRQDLAVKLKTINTRRYTMQDIGELEQRIQHLEYFTSLNLLEKSAADLTVTDNDGNTRFKNGILVDAFTGHNVGAVADEDYSISVDMEVGEARPPFTISPVDYIHDEDDVDNVNSTRRCHDALLELENLTATNGAVFDELVTGASSGAQGKVFAVTGSDTVAVVLLEDTVGSFTVGETVTAAISGISGRIKSIRVPEPGPLITLDYTQSDLTIQNLASTEFRISDAEFFDFIGDMKLTPNGDTWVDTSTKPDLEVNQSGNYDNWELLANAWGTSWGSWQTNYSGLLSRKTTRLSDSRVTKREGNYNNTYRVKNYSTREVYGKQQSREGYYLSAVPEVTKTHLGEKVVDSNIVPYMREKLITVECSKLRPNTRVYAFFDDIDVNDYCRPATKTIENYEDGVLYQQYRREFDVIPGQYGDNLVTDANGNLVFQFLVPNNDSIKFRVGTKPLRVTDVSDNGNDNTTAAEAIYSASGIHQTKQETVISTRNADLQQISVKDARTVVTDVRSYRTSRQSNLLSSQYIPPPCRRGCFLEGTLITMENGTVKPVELIKLGDRVKLGGGVFALGQFWINDLYEYRGVSVAGSHMVNHEGEWIRVRDIDEAVRKDVGEGTVVYVFGCENRRILINGIEFTDYFEIREQEAVQQIGEEYFEKWEEFADELERENEQIVSQV